MSGAPPLVGLELQIAAFEAALARGRLHHAWLLAGPQGLGKAAFALRAARRLLGARPDATVGGLGSAADDPVAQLMAARAHPDFLLLGREGADGKVRRGIPVDEARRLPEFFSKAPARARYRVAVIDSVDDMNPNAANAVLKTLEEPPPQGVLLLVSHAPGRLLDTIRSRCRTLRFTPWPHPALVAWLETEHGVEGAVAQAAARSGRGAPGAALAAVAGGGPDLRTEGAVLADGGVGQEARVLKLLEGLRGSEGAERFASFVEGLTEALRARAIEAATSGAPGADAWTEAWRRVGAIAGGVEGVNLDRGDAVWAMLQAVRGAASAASAA